MILSVPGSVKIFEDLFWSGFGDSFVVLIVGCLMVRGLFQALVEGTWADCNLVYNRSLPIGFERTLSNLKVIIHH